MSYHLRDKMSQNLKKLEELIDIIEKITGPTHCALPVIAVS